jgi:Ca-activated chloride channel homolog
MLSFVCRWMIRVLVLLLLAIPASAQTEPRDSHDTIKIKTDLVVVDAQVTDKRSREPIRGLKPTDFDLFEDGVKQQIESFSQDKLPLSIVLLVDISPSVRPVLEKIREGALAALQKLKPEDEVALMVFSGWTELIQDFTRDRQVLLDKLGAALEKKGSGTRIHEAIAKAARQMRYASTTNARRVIIAVTDNDGSMDRTDDELSEEEVRQTVVESGATVCGLIVRSAINVANAILSQHPMIQEHFKRTKVNPYALETGGEMSGAGKDEVNARLGEMFDRLRSRYSLGYLPVNQEFNGKYRKIKLTLTPEARRRLGGEIVVTARQGYYALDREAEALAAEEAAELEKKEALAAEPKPATSGAGAPASPAVASPAAASETNGVRPETNPASASDAAEVWHDAWRAAFRRPNPYAHLVMLDVLPLNKQTGALPDKLTKEDFEVVDGGAKREIVHFSRGEMPLSIVLLIDTGGNTPVLTSALRRGINQWLRRLKPDDEVAIMAFCAQAALMQPFTKDRKLLAARIRNFADNARKLNVGAGHNRTLAAFSAADYIEKSANPLSRRAIVTLTDGTRTPFSMMKHEQAAEMLLNAGGTVSAIVTKGTGPSTGQKIKGAVVRNAIWGIVSPISLATSIATTLATEAILHEALQDRSFGKLIQKSGGFVEKSEGEDAPEKLGLLIDRLRNRYVLGFEPAAAATPDRFRKLDVRLAPAARKQTPDVTVVAAQGYFARKTRPVE